MINYLSRLPVIEKFVRFWRIFRRDTGHKLWVYILISLLVTIVETVGVSLFLPLMSDLQGGGAKSEAEVKVDRLLAFFGLSYNLTTVLLCLAGVFVLKAVIQFGAGVYQSKIISAYLRTIATRIYLALSGQRYQGFLGRSIGTLANATVNESNRATVALIKFATLFPSMIAIAVFSLLALRVDWVVTLCVLGFGGSVVLSLRLLARHIRKVSIENTAMFGRFNELVLQSFNSFKYLRATSGTPAIQRQVVGTVARLAHSQYQLTVTSNFSAILNEPVAVLLMCGLFWQQAVLAHQPLSQVVVLAVIFYRLIREVMNFQNCWHGFAATMGSIDLVSKLIQDSEADREKTGGKLFFGLAREIRLKGLSFAYGERTVLQNFNLSIPRNSMVALVGESGSGKSTLVDLLTGILQPSGGQILIDGVPFPEIDLSSYRARLGYVTQEPALFSDSIANNISFWDQGNPADVRRRVEAAAEAANCLDFIRMQPGGFDTMLGDRGVNLSGGQRQRIAIARELYKAPDLLILDEATSALDGEAELEVQKSIEGLRGKITTVVIAHRLSTVRNADRICVLSGGRMIEEGQFTDLFAREGSAFRKFCELQGLR